jgi:hypothetical protein
MDLQMTVDEARELKLVLEAKLKTLLQEIARSDTRDFTEELRARLERVEAIDRRLGRLLDEPAAYA